jgi:hypothetical protein
LSSAAVIDRPRASSELREVHDARPHQKRRRRSAPHPHQRR